MDYNTVDNNPILYSTNKINLNIMTIEIAVV